jgi:hypothetical protein
LARGPSREVFEELCGLLGDGGRGPDDPVVTYLEAHLRSWPAHVARPAPMDWLIMSGYAAEHVSALRLCDTLVDEAFGMTGDDPMFFESLLDVHRGWRRVELEDVHFDRDGVCAALSYLDGCPIRCVALSYEWTSDEDVAALAALATLEPVVELDMGRCQVRDLGVLAETPLWNGLEILRAPRNKLTGEGVERALEALGSDTLRRVDLRYNPLGEVGARALARSPWLGRLEWLGLYVEDVGEEGAAALAASSTLPEHISAYWRGR